MEFGLPHGLFEQSGNLMRLPGIAALGFVTRSLELAMDSAPKLIALQYRSGRSDGQESYVLAQ